jgi:hypothetical protein
MASPRNTKVVSISSPAEMLEAAESMAKQENRTMSELGRSGNILPRWARNASLFPLG